MKIIKSNLGMYVCVVALILPVAAFAQKASKVTSPKVSANGEITGFSPTQGSMVKRKISSSASGSPCGQYLRTRKWSEGINNQGLRNEFTLAIGIAPVSANIRDPQYVDSRYVAFKEAVLNGTASMARSLESQISTKVSGILLTGNRTSDQAQALKSKAAAIKFEEKGPASAQSTPSKGMRLLNSFLNDKLKESGHDVNAERKARNEVNRQKKKELLSKAANAQKEVDRLTGQRSFKDIIEAVAREKMKGIYTAFTSENLSPEANGKTQLCVLLKYSPRSEKLADMMAARDFSNAPQLNPDIPLLEQLPDPATGQGVFQLVTMWGINVMVDEGGQVNLVAFGQSGYTNGDENQQIGAKRTARLNAEALIRLFINQTVAVQEASKLSQDVKTFKDGVKKTKLNKSLSTKMEQSAGFRPINGLKQILDWDGIHPVTNGGIAGSIVVWNASEAAGAVASKSRQNRVVKDRGGVKARNDAPSMRRSAKPKSRRGGLRGRTRSADF
jgi:hypothetical protein